VYLECKFDHLDNWGADVPEVDALYEAISAEWLKPDVYELRRP
jgi:hypothetical protein